MKDKVVVITGASSGIGKALSFKFAGAGSRLVIGARSIEKLESIKASLPGLDILTVKTDVSRQEDCKHLIDEANSTYGKIDVLINNAGIPMRALFKDVDLMVIRRIMDTNFWGTVYCTKFALPHLLETGGSVVGISSVAGYKGLPGRAGYSASKFAINGFLEVLRIENRKTGLHVLTACPGFTATNTRNVSLTADGTPQGESPRDEGKMMTAEAVADKIYHAILKRKPRIIMTTEGKLTVLLNKFIPNTMDRIVYNHMAKEPDSPFK